MRLIPFAILALLPQDLVKDWKHRWADAKVGSSVTFESTTNLPGIGEQKSTSTQTVAAVDGKKVTIEIADGEEKQKQDFHIGVPSEYDGSVTKGADDTFKVGDKTYACAVYEVKKEAGKVVQVLKVWKCADAPCWAVKQTWSQSMGGKAQAGWVEELVGTETLKVGGKELACAVVRKTTEAAAVKTVETEWRTREIPGGVAKATTQTFMGGKEMKEAAVTRVATAFEIK